MSRNGSGSYSLPSGNPVNNGTTIDPNWANNTMTDIATALTQSISQDGQTPITNNLPMTGFRHINVANAQNRNEYASAAQCQDNTYEWLTSVSGTDTITAVAAIGMGAYAAGQCFRFVSSGANTTTSVTLNLNGLGAKAITKNGATALAVGDIPSGAVVEVVYDGTQFQLVGTSVNSASTATILTGTSTASVQTTALGGGTADNTTFLRGDRTFQAIATMTATTSGLVPTPPNDVNQVLRGNGTFGAASLGRLYNITRYTTAGSGTYTKPANINRLLIRAIGGGGGSGGSSSAAGGGGGGGGGYGDLFITSPAASYAYSVGAAGLGGGSGSAGGSGGATTIAGISAGAGAAGTGGSGTTGGTGGSGGSTSGGGTNMRGGPGGAAAVSAGGSTSTGGNGGNCVLGGGGIGGGNGPGPSAGLSGGGAGGATGSGIAGSNGGPGYIEIWEFE
jgi:hypothetical protein